jgi:hypothetical protein
MSDTKILPAVQAGIAGNCNIIYEWHGDDIIGFGRVPTEYRDLVIEAINNQAQLATVTRERDEARAELANVKLVLKELEWWDIGYDCIHACISCRQLHEDGHAEDCPLAAALGDTTGGTEPQ